MKIGILFGGNSLEHEISIITAYQVKSKIEKRYDVYMLYLDFDNNLYIANKCSIGDFKLGKPKKLKKTSFIGGGVKGIKLDSVIIAAHGENTEDGVCAGVLRFYNIPFVGCDILPSSLCMNKYTSYKMLNSNGIPMLETKLITYEDYVNGIIIDEYPIILKPVYGGSSIGIEVAYNKDELDLVLSKLFKDYKEIICQKYYENIEEYNMAVCSSFVSALERINKKSGFFTFENKYTDSFKLMHQEINDTNLDEFRKISEDVYKLINASGIIRIDYFVIDNKIYVNEINTIPGALAMYLFSDFDFVIDDLIKKSIIEHRVIYHRGNFLVKSEINKW